MEAINKMYLEDTIERIKRLRDELNKNEHLCKMRDAIVELGIVPPVAEWTEMNPNL